MLVKNHAGSVSRWDVKYRAGDLSRYQLPGRAPFPLPQQVSLPGDLTSLLTGGSPVSSGLASAAGLPAAVAPVASLPAVAAPVAPVATPNPLLFPVSALP